MDVQIDRLFRLDVVISSIAVLVSSIICNCVWNIYFSPLARQRIPGPAYAAASDMWYQWHSFIFDRPHAILKLFKEYGPVVRIGPKRVMFIDSPTVHKIHRTLAFNKADFFKHLTFSGRENTAGTSDPMLHSRFRRWHAPAFRGDYMRKTAVALVEQIEDLVHRLKEDCATGAAVDVFDLLKVHTLDMLGIALFDTDLKQIKTHRHLPIVQHNANWPLDVLFRTVFPKPFYNLLKVLPSKRLQEIFAADIGFCELASRLYDETSDEPVESDNVSLAAAGKWYRDPATGEPTSKEEVVSELAIFLFAGTDTTSITLTYAFYVLAHSPELYEKLRTELQAAQKEGDPLDLDLLHRLPYLNMFIKEILRVHGPSGQLLERVVSKGGTELSGFFVPEGTTVGGVSRASGLREDLFPDPLRVDPERWLAAKNGIWVERDDIPYEEMNAAWYPFNMGVRACVGRPLAELEILMTISAVVRNFRISLHESTTEDSMRPIEVVLIIPKAQRCLLHFVPYPLER